MCTSMMKDSRFQVAVLSMLILSMTLASADSGPCETTPRFCQGLDCPKFSVVNTTHAYEVRDYDKCKLCAYYSYFVVWVLIYDRQFSVSHHTQRRGLQHPPKGISFHGQGEGRQR